MSFWWRWISRRPPQFVQLEADVRGGHQRFADQHRETPAASSRNTSARVLIPLSLTRQQSVRNLGHQFQGMFQPRLEGA